MRIFVVGSLNMDLVIKAPFMPDNGMTITGKEFMMNPGGKGGNQATAVAKMGGNAYMVGCVGDAFGNQLKNTLESYNVNIDFVKKTDCISSGVAMIVIVDGDNRIILDRGSNGCVKKELIDDALSLAEKGDYLVCQLEINDDGVLHAVKTAKGKGMITVLNPAPAKIIDDEILKNCDYFIPNQSECQFYTGIYPNNMDDAKACFEILKSKGIKDVIITLGEKGSCYCGESGCCMIPCFKADVVDTTAAGDTYVGAFVAMLSEGKSIKEAMMIASKAASITVTRMGAQQSMPNRGEVKI